MPEPGPRIDPVTGFAVDPTTGWLIHPGTGYVIEPGTGNLVYPDNYYYTGFRYEFDTGLVVDPNEATPTPTPTPTPIPSSTPTPSATPSASASATPSPSPTGTESSSALEADKAGESSESWSTHPATRIAVILGLLALGALYYTKLRGGTASGKKPE
ncbi:hypothetical protein [Arthrobacter roseus]|uniref:hypothetical protein n=1 Tax=Arthrobacter roseus TaxID=136274 RepID=UPI0019624829|nr:hypothetical protein [Arthrobacter roseus]